MNELKAIKQALDEWIAQEPTSRRLRLLQAADISLLLGRADEIKAAGESHELPREQMLAKMGV